VDKEGWIRCGESGRVDLKVLMEELSERGIEEILIEGGGEAISSFFEEGLVDEFTVFVGSLIIGGRDAPTPVEGEGTESLEGTVDLKLRSCEKMDDGILLKYEVERE